MQTLAEPPPHGVDAPSEPVLLVEIVREVDHGRRRPERRRRRLGPQGNAQHPENRDSACRRKPRRTGIASLVASIVPALPSVPVWITLVAPASPPHPNPLPRRGRGDSFLAFSPPACGRGRGRAGTTGASTGLCIRGVRDGQNRRTTGERRDMFLLNAWYVAALARDLGGELTARTICKEPVVLFRASDGSPAALADRCCHRYLPLSLGVHLGRPRPLRLSRARIRRRGRVRRGPRPVDDPAGRGGPGLSGRRAARLRLDLDGRSRPRR